MHIVSTLMDKPQKGTSEFRCISHHCAKFKLADRLRRSLVEVQGSTVKADRTKCSDEVLHGGNSEAS